MRDNSFHILFENIKKRTMKINNRDYSSFNISIDNDVIEIRYYDEEYIEFVKKTINGIIEKEKKAKHIIWCLIDDIEKYIPLEMNDKKTNESILKGKDDSGEIQIINKQEICGCDYITNEYFYIMNSKNRIVSYAHPLYPIFSMWAKMNNRFLVHGAVIGKNGNGVLIGARGGSGKSTLAVSWMLKGGEIVGDDYVIIARNTELVASKLYTSVGLKNDMSDYLNIKMDLIQQVSKQRNKKFFDASKQNFINTMKIKAIVFPSFDSNRLNNPQIREISPGKVMTQIIHSTINQTGERHNITYVKDLANILSGIPTYEILLSRNINENIECVNEFIDRDYK